MSRTLPVDLPLSALALARSLPLCLLLPLGARDIPRAIALSLWLALACLLYGFSSPAPSAVALQELVPALLYELGVGALFAAACAVPFVALQWSGQLAHATLLLRGAAELGPVGTLFRLAGLNVFFLLGGARALCVALVSSLEDVPLGAAHFANASLFAAFAQLLVDLGGVMLAMALPLVLSVWIVELGLAMLARASGHVFVATQAPARLLLAIALLGLTFTPVVDAFPTAVRDAMENARALIRALSR